MCQDNFAGPRGPALQNKNAVRDGDLAAQGLIKGQAMTLAAQKIDNYFEGF